MLEIFAATAAVYLVGALFFAVAPAEIERRGELVAGWRYVAWKTPCVIFWPLLVLAALLPKNSWLGVKIDPAS